MPLYLNDIKRVHSAVDNLRFCYKTITLLMTRPVKTCRGIVNKNLFALHRREKVITVTGSQNFAPN